MRKWTLRQFEWYRDNKTFITASNRTEEGSFEVVFYYRKFR